MSEVRVRALKDGPIEVSGPITIVDAAGDARAPGEDPVYLCRCGLSGSKPYCDGSHKKAGFQAEGWARPSSRPRT